MSATITLQRRLADDPDILQWQLDRIFDRLSTAAQQVISAAEAHVECDEEGVMLLFFEAELPSIIRRQLARREILNAIFCVTGIRVVMVSTGCNVYRFSLSNFGWWAIEQLHNGGQA